MRFFQLRHFRIASGTRLIKHPLIAIALVQNNLYASDVNTVGLHGRSPAAANSSKNSPAFGHHTRTWPSPPDAAHLGAGPKLKKLLLNRSPMTRTVRKQIFHR